MRVYHLHAEQPLQGEWTGWHVSLDHYLPVDEQLLLAYLTRLLKRFSSVRVSVEEREDATE